MNAANLHFIRTGLFPEKIGALLGRAQKAREDADYFPEVNFSKELAEQQLGEVKMFIQQCITFLTSKEFHKQSGS